METETSLWEMLVTWVMLAVMFGGAITASRWARRRRREGREASSYSAEGADAMVLPPNNTGGTEENAMSDPPPFWSLRMWIVERLHRVIDWVEKWFPQQPGTPMGPW